jgi:hypothetical protein
VRGGWVPIEEICRLYKLSADEFVAWERDSDRRSIFTACSARALKHILRLKRQAGRADIDRARTLTQRLALTMLARDGIAAIWQLHLASAEADQGGYPTAAASISVMRAEGAHAAVSAI